MIKKGLGAKRGKKGKREEGREMGEFEKGTREKDLKVRFGRDISFFFFGSPLRFFVFFFVWEGRSPIIPTLDLLRIVVVFSNP